MPSVTVEEAQARLPELIAAVARGEEVVITPAGQPAVQLVALPAVKPQPRFGSARGKVIIADNFDEPLEEFKEYTE